MNQMAQEVPPHFQGQVVASHWKVNESRESFERLMNHIKKKTNFYPYFQKSFGEFQKLLPEKAHVLDLGAGSGWTSALIGGVDQVEKVYSVDPSARRKSLNYLCQHMNTPPGVVEGIQATFTSLKLPQKADALVMCASFHHLYDRQFTQFLKVLEENLKPGAPILVANEHYTSEIWVLKRYCSWIKNTLLGKKTFYAPGNMRAPYPYDGEHWRSRKQLENLFNQMAQQPVVIERFEGDLCLDKHRPFSQLGWHYYYSIFRFRGRT